MEHKQQCECNGPVMCDAYKEAATAARLPRLLEDDRVEVQLVQDCTHVLQEPEIDGLLLHLLDAKNLLAKPAETKPACGCDPAAGIVCQTCAMMADKNVTELSAYVNEFIEKRFPSGLKGDIRQIIAECVLDAFHDGARWNEKAMREESGIIVTDSIDALDCRPGKIIMDPR